jgi:hypothetical protein
MRSLRLFQATAAPPPPALVAFDPLPLPPSADGLRVDWPTVESELLPVMGGCGERMLSGWRSHRPAAVGPLQGFVHERLFAVRPEAVEPLLSPPMERWPFPLTTRKADWAIAALDDMTGGEPLALALHRFVEEHGRVPDWPETVAWMIEPHILATFVGPAWSLFHTMPEPGRPSRPRWQLGIAWRIGNAYLSFLREMDFLSRMTHVHGIPLRFHIVADAVLKVDFFVGSSLVCVWMKNDYRERKATPVPAKGRVHDVTYSLKGVGWNSVMRASEDDLRKLACEIRG